LFRRKPPIHRISFIDEGSGKSFARREPSTGVDIQSGGKIFRSLGRSTIPSPDPEGILARNCVEAI